MSDDEKPFYGRRKRMSDQTKLALIDAYENWRPGSGITTKELAESFGVTSNSMYAVLRREGIPLKSGRGARRLMPLPAHDDVARLMVEVLLDQLTDLKIEQRALRNQLLELEVSSRPR